jgi:hypothetical protein
MVKSCVREAGASSVKLLVLDPICSENDDLALGSLVFRTGDCVGTEISHKISQRLRAFGIGYEHGVTSCYQMTAKRVCYGTGAYKSYFH